MEMTSKEVREAAEEAITRSGHAGLRLRFDPWLVDAAIQPNVWQIAFWLRSNGPTIEVFLPEDSTVEDATQLILTEIQALADLTGRE